ncbi:MAG: DUF2182 domain-containing protein [Sphingomonadales bacterium]
MIALAWAWLALWKMPGGGEIFTLPNFLTMFAMWAIMMVAMMVPSALPMILLYSASVKKARADGGHLAPLAVFVLGYVFIWTLFSAFAALLQLALQDIGIVNKMLVGTSPWLTGGVLILAGGYQLSPWKEQCLRFCQHPVMFIAKHWKTGTSGALRMGIIHGGYCVGCCWALMLLLFVGGVMNLLWIAAIAIYVLVEKMVPLPQKWGIFSGTVILFTGVYVIFGGF